MLSKRTPDVPPKLWEEYRQKPTHEVRNEIAMHYSWIVGTLAQKWSKHKCSVLELDDLKSAGFIGLLKAVETFDPERGLRFVTYSYPYVWGSMLDEMRKVGTAKRAVYRYRGMVDRAIEDFAHAHHRRPSYDEVASKLGWTADFLSETLASVQMSVRVSLDHAVGGGDETFAANIEQKQTQQNHDLGVMRLLTKGMSKQERLLVISCVYGGQTLAELAKERGVSAQRMQQIWSCLIKDMRRRLMSQGYEHADLLSET